MESQTVELYEPEPPSLLERSSEIAIESCDELTAEPACQLMAYNTLTSGEFENNETTLIKQIKRLSQIEWTHRHKKLLPTIGIELELPKEVFTQEQINVLNRSGIICSPDHFYVDQMEVAPSFSYSSEVQSRILEECAKLGINRENINTREYTDSSLHINLGIPKEINTKDDDYKFDRRVLVDAITYAYVSATRIFNRKTDESVKEKPAAESQTDSVLRLEIRTAEFADKSTYRMLKEVQLLAGSFFAFAKEKQGKLLQTSSENKEAKMSAIWDSFRVHALDILSEFGIFDKEQALYDRDRKTAAIFIKEVPELKKSLRSLFTTYAWKIRQVVEL